jgi:hypothetical protein
VNGGKILCVVSRGVWYQYGSSVSIVSGYGLDGWAIIEFSMLSRGERIFALTRVQTGSGAHPASRTMGTRGPFSGAKVRPGRDTDHSPTSRTEVKNE